MDITLKMMDIMSGGPGLVGRSGVRKLRGCMSRSHRYVPQSFLEEARLQ